MVGRTHSFRRCGPTQRCSGHASWATSSTSTCSPTRDMPTSTSAGRSHGLRTASKVNRRRTVVCRSSLHPWSLRPQRCPTPTTSRRGRMTIDRQKEATDQVAPATRAHIIGLDGARGLSCLGVAVMHVTTHFSPHTSATYKTNLVGLSLIYFYVLSGFLLFLPYIRNLTAQRASAKLPST